MKILMRLLYPPSTVKMDDKRMEDWLMSLAEERSGYKDYYTMRKKIITDAMVLGIDQKEYWANCGKLMELKQMNVTAMGLLEQKTKRKKKYEAERDSKKTG